MSRLPVEALRRMHTDLTRMLKQVNSWLPRTDDPVPKGAVLNQRLTDVGVEWLERQFKTDRTTADIADDLGLTYRSIYNRRKGK